MPPNQGISRGVSGKQPVVIAFTGDLDFTMRETLRARLAELADGEPAIIDLTGVDYMDSLALAELVMVHRLRVKAGCSAPRVVVGEKIARLYEISGLATMLPPFQTLAEAQAG
jgi:anti-anti-sigma factor